MTLREILQALRRRRRLVLAGILLSVLVGAGLAASLGTEYRADARLLLVQPQPGATPEETLLTQQKLNVLAITYGEIVSSPRFVRLALDDAGVARRGASISGDAVKSTSIVEISVRAGRASTAEDVAAAIADAVVEELRSPALDLPSAEELSAVPLEDPSSSSSSANRLFALLAVVVAGAALSITAGLLLETP